MSRNTYDYIVVGAGLTGLSIACGLSRNGHSVALLDTSDHPGGINRPVTFERQLINNGLRHIPASDAAMKALGFLENLLGLKIVNSASESLPKTFASGGIKTFVGFGENAPRFLREISQFASGGYLRLNLEPYAWTGLLADRFTGTFIPRSCVTRFHPQGDSVAFVTINGSKTLSGRNFIFTASVRDLISLLPEIALSARVRQRLANGTYWTALCLDLCHSSPVTDDDSLFILDGASPDDLGPCVGKFLPSFNANGSQRQISQWMTWLDEESSEESELTAAAIKKIKRQIRRVWPDAIEGLVSERIVLCPNISGSGDLKLTAGGQLPSLSNLWIASAALSPFPGLIGSLLQAELILTQLTASPPKHKESPEISF
ncbi:MAG: NAD(P)/FAD-dependent oxidoreductase [Bdellovibrionaceae bacterium]|nr:NAD(P)/FAD-dependent oxidoreductase [Pseudobdellovibrionaceae bacterium]